MAGYGVKGNSGGKKGRSGRKPKALEMGLQALLDECFTAADRRDLFMKLAEMARNANLEAIKLLLAYTYGKPVEQKDSTVDGKIEIVIKREQRTGTTKTD
jgi:hypothetical protein